MSADLQALLHADDGYLLAGLWVVVVAAILSAPAALAWCARQVKRGRRAAVRR